MVRLGFLSSLQDLKFVSAFDGLHCHSPLSPLRKLTNCIKWNILDEIFDFGNSVMPEHQWIEKLKNIAKRNIFGFVSFRSGLTV